MPELLLWRLKLETEWRRLCDGICLLLIALIVATWNLWKFLLHRVRTKCNFWITEPGVRWEGSELGCTRVRVTKTRTRTCSTRCQKIISVNAETNVFRKVTKSRLYKQYIVILNKNTSHNINSWEIQSNLSWLLTSQISIPPVQLVTCQLVHKLSTRDSTIVSDRIRDRHRDI